MMGVGLPASDFRLRASGESGLGPEAWGLEPISRV